jgi:hypothetical protein
VADLGSQCQFFVGSCGFPFVLRANGTSTCHLRCNHPRRNLSPPLYTNGVLRVLLAELRADTLLLSSILSLAAMPVFECALDLTVGIAPFHIFALIVLLLATRQGHLDLDFATLEIQLEWDQRQATLLCFAH